MTTTTTTNTPMQRVAMQGTVRTAMRMAWAFRDAAKDANDATMVAVADRVMVAVMRHRAPNAADWAAVAAFNDATDNA